MEEFESLGGFLEHVALVMENAEADDGDMVSIMTLHGAKGLEFDTVFLPGWEEGLFPHQRAMDESGMKGLEEERRLAYVGLTRARASVRRSRYRRQPARPQSVAERAALALHRRAAARACRGRHSAPGLRPLAEPALCPLGRRRPARRLGAGRRRSRTVIEARRSRVADADDAYPARRPRVPPEVRLRRVVAAEGDRLDIDFDKAGAKKVIASFVVPAEPAVVKKPAPAVWTARLRSRAMPAEAA